MVLRANEKEGCPYCDEGKLLDAFGVKIAELPASKIVLFREQSHHGRLIVASKSHVSEVVDLNEQERSAYIQDIVHVASVMHEVLGPDKINYGAYGDGGCHLHFHLCPKYADDSFEWGKVFAMNPDRIYLDDSRYRNLAKRITDKL